MKKILCLILCIVCALAILASCGEDPIECDAHVDADKNTACDTCGTPVYTVVEKVPTEEQVVEMIVSAIPEDAKLGNVWTFAEDGIKPLAAFVKNDKLDGENMIPVNTMLNDTLVAYKFTTQTAGTETTFENWLPEEHPDDLHGYMKDDKFEDTYVVYNVLTDSNIYTYTGDEYDYDEVNYVDALTSITLEENMFISIEIKEWAKEFDEFYGQEIWDYTNVSEMYLPNGTKIYSSSDDFYGNAPENLYFDGEFGYVTIGDIRYAYDQETYALKTQGDENAFIYRPEFDFRTDTYGYVKGDDKIYVFDLAKWIDCVYSYEIPANAETWFLSNGNILTQRMITLNSETKNYDYVSSTGSKIDIKYYIVDVAAKSQTEVEFGYNIKNVVTVEEGNGYNAAVKNIVTVDEIKDKNLGKTLELYCDDTLNILAERDDVLPEFVGSVVAIADGRFLGTVVYGDNSSIAKIFDANGNEIAILPNGAEVCKTYIYNDGSFYDFDMKLLLDLDADEENVYTVIGEYDDYILLANGIDTYYWSAALSAPVMVAKATNVPVLDPEETTEPVITNPVIQQNVLSSNNNYFVVATVTTTIVEGEDPIITVEYNVYNSNKECIVTSEKLPVITERADYWIITVDGDICIQLK